MLVEELSSPRILLLSIIHPSIKVLQVVDLYGQDLVNIGSDSVDVEAIEIYIGLAPLLIGVFKQKLIDVCEVVKHVDIVLM